MVDETIEGLTQGAAEETPRGSIGWHASPWARALHDGLAELGAISEAEGQLADAALAQLAPRILPEDASDEDCDTLGVAVAGTAAEIGRGAYAHLHGHPEATDRGPAWARATVQALEKVPEIANLRSLCAGDADMAAIATASILRHSAEHLAELFDALDDEDADPEQEGEENPGEGSPGAPGGSEDGAAGEDGSTDDSGTGGPHEAGDGSDEDAGPGDQAAVDAAAQALADALGKGARAAIREVAQAKGDLDGLLPGLGTGTRERSADGRRLKLLDRIRNDPRMQQILRIAGRICRVADRVREVPSPDVRVELADVERGADLPRVLPSELAGLRSRPRRLLVLKGLADRSLLQRRMEGRERLGRGPMVVLLDASDSMSYQLADGLDRMGWASAIAIACVRAAVEQTRPISVCTFNGAVRPGETWTVRAGDRRGAEELVLALVGVRESGGTSFDGPLTWALDQGAERDRADLVLITDGLAGASDPVVERLTASKARGLRLWGVIAGSGGFHGSIATIADGVTEVTGAAGTDPVDLIGSTVAP